MQEKKRKVLIIGMTSIVGGIESFLMNFYEKIDLSKVQIDFLITGKLIPEIKNKIIQRGGNVYEVDKIKLNPLKSLIKLKKFYKNNNYDIIHMNLCNAFYFIYGLPAIWCNKNIRVMVHSHNGGDSKKILHIISKPILNHYCTDFVACSDLAARWMFTKKRIKNNNITIINNAIDTNRFIFNIEDRKNIRKKFIIKDDDFIIGHVGRFEKQKNHEFLIETFKKICEKKKNIKLLLVGTGTLESQLKNKVKELNLEDKVIFTGVISDVSKIYQAMDLFVLPSIFEGLPVSGIEAQASGLMCFFSNTITKESKISNNVEFIPLSQEIWVKKIIDFTNCSFERKNMLDEIKKANYDMQTEVKKIERIYLN